LEADQIIRLSPPHFAGDFADLLGQADAVLLIAPEEHGVLAGLSEQALEAGVDLLGSLPEAVRAVGDKWLCHKLLQKAGLPTPLSILVTPEEAQSAVRDMGFPAVLKTRDGQGGLGVCLLTDDASLKKSLKLLGGAKSLLLQRYHQGIAASVSLLLSERGVLPLCINAQTLLPGIPFSYQGGYTPLSHPEAPLAISAAMKAACVTPGLRGFVGVDLLFAQGGGCLIIEVNPRITAAYAGVRQVVDCNLAQAITKACLEGTLPAQVKLSGTAEFGQGNLGYRDSDP
jgi:predicted ATP-grasp superfamily ATP-dependent carboligase